MAGWQEGHPSHKQNCYTNPQRFSSVVVVVVPAVVVVLVVVVVVVVVLVVVVVVLVVVLVVVRAAATAVVVVSICLPLVFPFSVCGRTLHALYENSTKCKQTENDTKTYPDTHLVLTDTCLNY